MFELPDRGTVAANNLAAFLDARRLEISIDAALYGRRYDRERREAIAMIVSDQIRDAVADGVLDIPEDEKPEERTPRTARARRISKTEAAYRDKFYAYISRDGGES